jgi:hypothetical protein
MTDGTTEAVLAQVTCRLLQPDDGPGVARLWQSETPWGEPRRELVAWFNQNPTPGSFVAVAVDERGDIVGQIVMMATRLSADGGELPAIHQFAPIVARATRTRATDPREHPLTKLIKFAMHEAKARNFAVVYSLPDPKWEGLFRRMPGLRVGKFPLWTLPLPLDGFVALDESYSVAKLERFDERVDRLWRAAAQSPGCQLVRDAGTLQWRVGSARFEVLAVYREDELVAVVAARQKEKTQWTVCDLVAADEEARAAALAAVCNAGHARALLPHQKFPLRKVALLTTPSLEVPARRLGFSRDAYDYLLLAVPLDDAIGGDAIAPERWYVTDNE